MPVSSPTAWVVWLIIALFLIVCVGIVIWFAIDNNIPGKIGTDQGVKQIII